MKTRWYLGAANNDPNTNDYIVGVLGAQRADALREVRRCADGQVRHLYDCPEGYKENVRSAIAGVTRFFLKLEVFKEETDGNIVRFDLWKTGPRKAAKQKTYRRGVHRASSA